MSRISRRTRARKRGEETLRARKPRMKKEMIEKRYDSIIIGFINSGLKEMQIPSEVNRNSRTIQKQLRSRARLTELGNQLKVTSKVSMNSMEFSWRLVVI